MSLSKPISPSIEDPIESREKTSETSNVEAFGKYWKTSELEKPQYRLTIPKWVTEGVKMERWRRRWQTGWLQWGWVTVTWWDGWRLKRRFLTVRHALGYLGRGVDVTQMHWIFEGSNDRDALFARLTYPAEK